MQFNPDCLIGLSHKLKVLDVSGNRLSDLSGLIPLRSLRSLRASDNNITSMVEGSVITVVSNNAALNTLYLQGNPVAKSDWRYRDFVIFNSISIEDLDGKAVTLEHRRFVKERENRAHTLQQPKQQQDENESMDISDDKNDLKA